jgi:hypothetical protein
MGYSWQGRIEHTGNSKTQFWWLLIRSVASYMVNRQPSWTGTTHHILGNPLSSLLQRVRGYLQPKEDMHSLPNSTHLSEECQFLLIMWKWRSEEFTNSTWAEFWPDEKGTRFPCRSKAGSVWVSSWSPASSSLLGCCCCWCRKLSKRLLLKQCFVWPTRTARSQILIYDVIL